MSMESTDIVKLTFTRLEIFHIYCDLIIGKRHVEERKEISDQLGNHPYYTTKEQLEITERAESLMVIIDKLEAELEPEAIQVANDFCNSLFLSEEQLRLLADEIKDYKQE